jgi:hypothetical protein
LRTLAEINASNAFSLRVRRCYTMQFFLQLATQFYLLKRCKIGKYKPSDFPNEFLAQNWPPNPANMVVTHRFKILHNDYQVSSGNLPSIGGRTAEQ